MIQPCEMVAMVTITINTRDNEHFLYSIGEVEDLSGIDKKLKALESASSKAPDTIAIRFSLA